MLFTLLVLVAVFSVAFFQANQGLFSALIMTVLTICCAAAAIGTYEWVAAHWLAPLWKPDYASAIALAATFGIPLVILRMVTDQTIRRACLLPSWMDRAGGAVCGLITAMIMTGIMAVGIQMLPFSNGSILGFARVPIQPRQVKGDDATPTAPDADTTESNLWLNPDRFAVATAAILSDGVFSGGRSFLSEHPDLVQAIGWVNAAPMNASRYAPPGSISFEGTEPVSLVYKVTPPPPRKEEPPTYDPIYPKDGSEFRMIRVQLKREARGEARSHIFSLRQFLLVGQEAGASGAKQFHPIAIQENKTAQTDTAERYIRLEKVGRYGYWPVTDDRAYFPREGSGPKLVEIVFELPTGFTPVYIEYKHAARAAVSFQKEKTDSRTGPKPSRSAKTASARGSEPNPTTNPRKPPDQTTAAKAGSRSGGNIRGVTAKARKSHFGDGMPLTLRAYSKFKNAEIRRGRLVDGHVVAIVEEQEGGTNRSLDRFHVPSDKRLLHLNTGQLKARSTLGKAISQTVTTVQNYFVEDANGRQYHVVGKYALANVDGRRVCEIQYFTSPVGSIGGLGKFNKIKDRHLEKDYDFVLLFLVDPGAKIVSFSSGGSATRRDELSGENLTAPG